MKSATTRKILNALLIMVLASLCAPAFAAKIDLAVVGTYPNEALKIAANDSRCGNDLNCIQTTKGNQPDLFFMLAQACNPQGPQYRLTAMTLAMKQYGPDGNKAFGRHNVTPEVQSDFDTDAMGNVQWSGVNKLMDHMIMVNDKNETAYSVYFQIEAVHCDDPSQVIYLDPRIDNTGK